MMLGQEDAWIVVNGDALDITQWIRSQCGGEQSVEETWEMTSICKLFVPAH